MTTKVEEGLIQVFSAPLWRKTTVLKRWRRIKNMILDGLVDSQFSLHKADCSENSASKYEVQYWLSKVKSKK
jgi:hypothetical protein